MKMPLLICMNSEMHCTFTRSREYEQLSSQLLCKSPQSLVFLALHTKLDWNDCLLLRHGFHIVTHLPRHSVSRYMMTTAGIKQFMIKMETRVKTLVAPCGPELNPGEAVDNRGLCHVFVFFLFKRFRTLWHHYCAVELPKRFRTRRLRTPTFMRMRNREDMASESHSLSERESYSGRGGEADSIAFKPLR